MKIVGTLLTLAVLAAVGLYVAFPLGLFGPGKARKLCIQEVESRLTAPASAEFVGWGQLGDALPEHRFGSLYRWNSHVDAQNGFGAMLRTDFECEVFTDVGLVQLTLDE